MSEMLTVLLIDDNPDEVQSLEEQLIRSGPVIRTEPEGVTQSDVESAGLVLVDQVLEVWPERENRPLAASPLTGTALIEVLRSNLSQDRALPFALYSANLDRLLGGSPDERRPYVLSRLNNLDWVFPKDMDARQVAGQAGALLQAAQILTKSWPSEDLRETAENLLELDPENAWHDAAWQSVRDCFPPIDEIHFARDSIVFLRWLLHRVLPYPTFLLSRAEVAARLAVEPEALIDVDHRTQLGRGLGKARYRGMCRDFMGTRWWRVGLESFLWESTNGKPFDREALREILPTDLRNQALPESVSVPVVTISADLEEESQLSEIGETVRVQPDDWPAFAELPRVRRALLDDHDRLRALVAISEISDGDEE